MTFYDRESYVKADSPIKKILLKLFKRTDQITIFDIGACEGEESLRYCKLFPNAQILTFEPLPKNQDLIRGNIKKYNANNIELISCAVSNLNGFSQFYVSSGHPDNESNLLDWDFGNKSSSLLLPNSNNNPKWLEFKEKISVETITLKKVIEEREISQIDFIHMDVQGAELDVLKGADKYLKQVKAIWLEVSNIELYKGQPLILDVENYMTSKGFTLIKTELEGQVGDQFYLNNNYYRMISLFRNSIQWIYKKQIKS
ncbi:MAG: FkbM family methyltransferase [Winogradskyella sp.]|uniref:FkbM family methyltransferase n=1 Tax=Winogradskyella sp. TaxID=1883156 RepID=UPI00182D9168|nr:FkbM family methyltransferase [Winogradskyella sp.]